MGAVERARRPRGVRRCFIWGLSEEEKWAPTEERWPRTKEHTPQNVLDQVPLLVEKDLVRSKKQGFAVRSPTA